MNSAIADTSTGAAVALIVLMLVIFAVAILGLVFWIVKLIEVVKLTDGQYRAANTDKTTWVLVVALAGWIGALIWQLGSTRERVLAAPAVPAWGVQPFQPTPPGWYPDPTNATALRWWDGGTWTEHRQPRPPG